MILSKNRLFTKQEPDRDAKSIYIFSEGVKREKQYFNYFKEIDSRINIEVYDLSSKENNSPLGLYKIAESAIQSESNPKGKYEVIEGDEVWIVIDTDKDKFDSRRPQIEQIKAKCDSKNWNISQSNPCFEVWLYYHLDAEKPNFQNMDTCKQWKQYLQKEKGGFDSKKHPIFIQTALINSEILFQQDEEGFPSVGTTQIFRLAQSILSVSSIKVKISEELNNRQNQ